MSSDQTYSGLPKGILKSSDPQTPDLKSPEDPLYSVPPTAHTQLTTSSIVFQHNTPYALSTIGAPTDATFDDYDLEEDDSPYEEVRASVSNTDDPEMPVYTFRLWTMGMSLTLISAAVNTFFNFRSPATYVASLVVLLVAYPIGKAMAFVLPIKRYRFPSWLGGFTFCLNPGPFNIKEHVSIYLMANVAIYPVYALNAIVVQEHWYHVNYGIGFNFVFGIASQLTGFGLAGLCRRILIEPASLIWPQTLVTSTLLNTLHAEDDYVMEDMDKRTKNITRYKWFLWVTGAAFLWQWVTGFFFTGLATFSWICLMAPKNKVVNQLFGTQSGLGMSFITFDWGQISWIGSPLMVPWWAEVHIFIGFVLSWWFILPILYYTNTYNLAHLPIGDTNPYDRFGKIYNVTRVLNEKKLLNETAYEEYSDLYISPPHLMFYLLTFALSTCIITHTLLYHGRSLWNSFRSIETEPEDVHARLMKVYPQVPRWWYWGILIFFFTLAVVAVERWDTTVPVWSLFLALLLPAVYIIPSGLIYAVTGQNLTLNLLAQIIPGALLPGDPFANMIFKTYAVESLYAGLLFTQDLKLGHYIKIPPRKTFTVQVVASVLSSITQIAVKHWLFDTRKDICERGQPDRLTCPRNRVFYTASAIWGLVGPARQFGPSGTHHVMLYAMVIGAVAPIPFWIWQRKFPDTKLKFINLPVLLNGPTFAPPATGINYSSWFVVGFIFQYLIRKRNFRWWSKFNYITSAALDSGTIISVLIIFLSVQLKNPGSLKWWGNRWFDHTLDGIGVTTTWALRDTPPEGFAPSPAERLGR